MDIGSEIGTKMRSAVKAKLFELGTGDVAGYIDDELPDYIMIMIANKRSKQQMVSDLNLFLGSKTMHFVNWLHEVLQKLQEVTIPTAVAKNNLVKKTKVLESKKVETKKEKRGKDNKKEKIKPNKSNVTNSVLAKTAEYNSINDVVADHLLDKAKKDQDLTSTHEAQVKKGKEAKNPTTTTTTQRVNEINSSVTAEISSTTDATEANGTAGTTSSSSKVIISGDREKDLAELAEIQRKIYAAKKQLKQTGELDVNIASEDEDFLNLKDDDDSTQSYDESVDLVRRNTIKQISREKSTDKESNNSEAKRSSTLLRDKSNEIQVSPQKSQHEDAAEQSVHEEEETAINELETQNMNSSKESSEVDEQRNESLAAVDQTLRKRPVHERLGARQREASEEREKEVPRLRKTRHEQELYVPAFRRHETDAEPRDRRGERGRERMREPERSRERSRERERSRGEREREREREARQRHAAQSLGTFKRRLPHVHERRSSSRDSTDSYGYDGRGQRIGSRVIIAPAKQIAPSDSEDEKPVNSVIKIKPRVPVSPSKQASKNLLMRAVADAQRSTILAKTKDIKPIRSRLRLGEKPVKESLKRSTKSSARADTGGVGLFRRTTQNLIIEVGAERKKRRRCSNDFMDDKYVPTAVISGRSESDEDNPYGSKTNKIRKTTAYVNKKSNSKDCDDEMHEDDDIELEPVANKTQFVVTLNDDKASSKYRSRHDHKRSRSNSPQPQVSSSSSAQRERALTTQRSNVKSRLSGKATSSSSMSPHGAATRLSERESNNSTPVSMSPTRGRRSERVEVYRKPKDVKKIIIQNDSDDDELSPKKRRDGSETRTSKKLLPTETPNTINVSSPRKRKLTPIKYRGEERDKSKENDLENEPLRKRRAESAEQHERELSQEHVRKISIRNAEVRKYDNIPALSSVALDSTAMKVIKPKQLCKFHPNCTKSFCEYYHPKSPCKTFPNCKYGEKCMYSHPSCKYDLACTNLDCIYQHSGARNPSQLQPTAPPLSSHVVPVQNYKTISAVIPAPLPVDNLRGSKCKYFPNCTKAGCTFIHPKMCRFGKNCINPTCIYYHHDAPSSSKFKWVASCV